MYFLNIFHTEKGVQTDCYCECYNRGGSDDVKQVLIAVDKISAELRDLKSNITGKAVVTKMKELFPIKSEMDLLKIDHNIENTENFELRLVNTVIVRNFLISYLHFPF